MYCFLASKSDMNKIIPNATDTITRARARLDCSFASTSFPFAASVLAKDKQKQNTIITQRQYKCIINFLK